ncbi:MAG: HAMP domain-containing histidine kinase [Chloroflexota bacterium]|nr:HAMP domain-containing histidine kinase [Chloroflexota bacterium]
MSLRLRLTLLIGLLTGGTLLVFAVVFYLVLQANLHGELDTRLRERAALLLRAAGITAQSNDNPRLPAPSALVEFDSPGIYAELIGADDTIEAVSPNLPRGRLPLNQTLIDAARVEGAAFATARAGRDDELRVLAVSVPGAAGRVLVVAGSLEPLQRTLGRARTLLVGGGSLALVAAIAGTMLLAGRALAPIGELMYTAGHVAATGHYHTRVPLPERNDEIAQLARTINELIATVERTLGQQRQFVADTSHELRSPLTTVLANLDLLRRNLDATERELSIAEATAEARRMRRLVNDLLLLAQADATQAIAHAPLRLDPLVREVVVTMARQAPRHVIRAHVSEPVTVTGDAERLQQVLRNVVENATVHTPPGSQIDVVLRCADGVAQIIIRDTGAGITADHLPYLWDRFYRIDKARSRAAGGSGLGLAIVKYIVEAHGGTVAVTSMPGTGTTFSVGLPLAPVEHHAPRSRPASYTVDDSSVRTS